MKTIYPNKKLSNNINFLSMNFKDKINLRSSSANDKVEFKCKNNLSQSKNDIIPKKSKIFPSFGDADTLQDQLMKIKQEFNKKVLECNNYKIEILHLEEEIKKNNKTIEEVMKEVSRVCPDIYNVVNSNISSMSQIEDSHQVKPSANINLSGSENSDFNVPQTKLTMNPATLMRLKDIYKINHMKKQISNLKIALQAKEDEITVLKSNAKITKYHALESDYIIKVEDYMNIKNSYDQLKENFSNKEAKLKEANEEKDYYKSMMLKAKGNYDEVKDRLKFVIEENSKLNEANKTNEEKITTFQFMVQSLKFKLTQKDNEINILKEDLKNMENFKNEKAKIDKKMNDYINSISSLKEELEKKNQKLKDFEKQHLNLRSRLEEEYENKITVMNKKIKNLESDLIQYKDKVKNLDTQLTLKKISQKINNNNNAQNNIIEGNDNKPNEGGNEVNEFKEKLEFEVTKNNVLEEKIKKLKSKIVKLKEKLKENELEKTITKVPQDDTVKAVQNVEQKEDSPVLENKKEEKNNEEKNVRETNMNDENEKRVINNLNINDENVSK